MCTIAILCGVRTDWPVVVAGNRDERFARPARPPGVWPGSPALIAPVDELAGGTWMGMTRAGFFAAITNQRDPEWHLPHATSRGHLVIDVLRRGDSASARALLRGVDARRYNPFNLLFGDASGLFVGYGRQDRAEVQIAAVPSGVHVLPNDVLDCPVLPKVARLRDRLSDAGELSREDLVRRLEELLRDRERAPLSEIPAPAPGHRQSREQLRELDAIAIETPDYGTRSSSIVALHGGGVAGFWYADGPPQKTPFENLLHLTRVVPPSPSATRSP